MLDRETIKAGHRMEEREELIDAKVCLEGWARFLADPVIMEKYLTHTHFVSHYGRDKEEGK